MNVQSNYFWRLDSNPGPTVSEATVLLTKCTSTTANFLFSIERLVLFMTRLCYNRICIIMSEDWKQTWVLRCRKQPFYLPTVLKDLYCLWRYYLSIAFVCDSSCLEANRSIDFFIHKIVPMTTNELSTLQSLPKNRPKTRVKNSKA